jgi:hypothetical protein
MALPASAQVFQLPTANRALLEPGGQERFFVGTAGKPWTSGTFGCVRSGGWQMHEGIDIKCLQRDKRGEPLDPVMAAAEGTVAYVNTRPSLSNYGIYIVLRHEIGAIEIYSLYAHLSAATVKAGQRVAAGQILGTMGRTANTREGISKDRAHLHFEVNLMLNERFAAWHKESCPGERNDHGQWNGQNFVAVDPLPLLPQPPGGPARPPLAKILQQQTELCRVRVRATHFPWLKRCPELTRPATAPASESVAGYEIALNFNGLPFELTPLPASQFKKAAGVQLISVNEAEQKRNPGRRLVKKRGSRWELTRAGTDLISLLTY